MIHSSAIRSHASLSLERNDRSAWLRASSALFSYSFAGVIKACCIQVAKLSVQLTTPFYTRAPTDAASNAILRDGSILGFLFGQKLRQRLALSVIFRCSEVLTKILQIVAM